MKIKYPMKVLMLLLVLITIYFVSYTVFYIVISYFLLGLIDVLRNRPISFFLLKKYFFGNGLLTLILSPLNLIWDILSYRNKKIYSYNDYPDSHRREIDEVINVFRTYSNDIIDKLRNASESDRTMIFYQWYGKRYNDTIPEFNKKFKYIKTLGVSVFKKNKSTSWHFGPLRLSIRILYNLKPDQSNKAYIMTMGKTHYWQDNPFFSFDDTLFHRSVNESDAQRYCAFIDIIRPTPIHCVFNFFVKVLSFTISGIRRVFYKNWKLLK